MAGRRKSGEIIKKTCAFLSFRHHIISNSTAGFVPSSSPQVNVSLRDGFTFFGFWQWLIDCHKEGWVHAEASSKKDPDSGSTYETLTYVFPSKLHRKKIEFLLLKTDFTHQKFQSVEELSFAAYKNLKEYAHVLRE